MLQKNSDRFSQRPFLTLGGFGLITAIAQLGMAVTPGVGFSLAMAFLIGAGTAGLLSSCNLITQIGSEQVMRGRMAGLSQIAFLGGGGTMACSGAVEFGRGGGKPGAVAALWPEDCSTLATVNSAIVVCRFFTNFLLVLSLFLAFFCSCSYRALQSWPFGKPWKFPSPNASSATVSQWSSGEMAADITGH